MEGGGGRVQYNYPETKYDEKKKEVKEMKKKMKKLGGWRRAGPMDGRPLVAFTRGRNWAQSSQLKSSLQRIIQAASKYKIPSQME